MRAVAVILREQQLEGGHRVQDGRIQGLLASHGLVPDRIDATLPQWISSARLWDGSSLPAGARARILREFERWSFTHQQILAIEKERRDAMNNRQEKGFEKVRRLYALRGIGQGAAWTYGLEFFSWRQFRNGKEVGALAGLTPTPYQSGDLEHELGISRAGNRALALVPGALRARRAASPEGRDRGPRAQAPGRAVALRRDRRAPGGSRIEGVDSSEAINREKRNANKARQGEERGAKRKRVIGIAGSFSPPDLRERSLVGWGQRSRERAYNASGAPRKTRVDTDRGSNLSPPSRLQLDESGGLTAPAP
jgi:hypothetical protein